MTNQIVCPKCNFHFSIDEALSKEAQSELAEKLEQKLKEKYNKQSEAEKKQWQEEIRQEWEHKEKLLQQKINQREEGLEKARKHQQELLLEKDKWELEKREWALKNQREMVAWREKIMVEASGKLQEEQRLKDAEKDKLVADLKRQVTQMKRQIEQGSQQLQGEVLELDLEEKLKREFADDVIEPVGKGVTGADVRQRVYNKNGVACGKIIWETKRTKNWTQSWVGKLVEDMRREEAESAVLVTTTMPKEVTTNLVFYQKKIWVCKSELAMAVANLLRYSLIKQKHLRDGQEHGEEKIRDLAKYISSPSFIQKIEAQFEIYVMMKESLDKERRVAEKLFGEREQQINKLTGNIAHIYGSLQAATKNSLPNIKTLEIAETN
jgi:hypothetical protein